MESYEQETKDVIVNTALILKLHTVKESCKSECTALLPTLSFKRTREGQVSSTFSNYIPALNSDFSYLITVFLVALLPVPQVYSHCSLYPDVYYILNYSRHSFLPQLLLISSAMISSEEQKIPLPDATGWKNQFR